MQIGHYDDEEHHQQQRESPNNHWEYLEALKILQHTHCLMIIKSLETQLQEKAKEQQKNCMVTCECWSLVAMCI